MEIFIIMLAAFLLGQSVPTFFKPVICAVKAKTGKRRVKPLDCEACSSFWLALIFGIIFISNSFTGTLFSILMATVVFKATCLYERFKLKMNEDI
jgi:hypothetical protein